MTEEKCPCCKGSGMLQDPVHNWVVGDCFICKGTGIKPDNYDRLYGPKVRSSEQSTKEAEA